MGVSHKYCRYLLAVVTHCYHTISIKTIAYGRQCPLAYTYFYIHWKNPRLLQRLRPIIPYISYMYTYKCMPPRSIHSPRCDRVPNHPLGYVGIFHAAERMGLDWARLFRVGRSSVDHGPGRYYMATYNIHLFIVRMYINLGFSNTVPVRS